jgi:hypothetical protein
MDYRTLIGAALAAAFSVAIPAQAADEGKAASGKSEADQDFSKLDKTKDGSISRAEAKDSEHEKDFSKYDKNKDGKLSKPEFSAAERSEEAASGGTHKEKKE